MENLFFIEKWMWCGVVTIRVQCASLSWKSCGRSFNQATPYVKEECHRVNLEYYDTGIAPNLN